MDERCQRFNELMFEAYCKTAIDHAIQKEGQRKSLRGGRQLPLSELTDAVLYAIAESAELGLGETEASRVFDVRGKPVPVYHAGLAQAISYLLPKDREIILRYYFLNMTDEGIAERIGMTLPTVNRRRKDASYKLRLYLEGVE